MQNPYCALSHLPSEWFSSALNIFRTGRIAASLETRRMSEPEYPSVFWKQEKHQFLEIDHQQK